MRLRLLGIALSASLTAGCGAMLRNAAREVTPAAVSGVVAGIADPQTQRQLVAAVDEGRVKTVTTRLSAGFVDGMLDSLEDPARRARLEALVGGISAKVAGAVVDGALARALDERVQARMRHAMRATVSDLVSTVFDVAGENASTSEARAKTVGKVARELTKQATLGFQAALDETRRDRASGKMRQKDGALLIAAGNMSQVGNRVLWTLGIGLGVLGLGFAITLIWAIRKNRLRRSELAERDGALLQLTQAIKATATLPGTEALQSALASLSRNGKNGKPARKWFDARSPEAWSHE